MKYLSLLILLSASFTVKAQDTIVKYFDSNWEEVQQENANYYRKAFKNTNEIWTACDYYMDGQIQMSGTYKSKRLKKKNGLFVSYYKSGMKKSEGEYLNNKYNGEWRWYHKNGQISSKEKYVKDELKYIWNWNEDGSSVEGKIEKIVYPEFKGGDDALKHYISTHVIYPEKAQERCIVGRVYVAFVIGKSGEIEKSWVKGYADPLLKTEALRVINNMPKWSPGKVHNLPVKVSYVVPINFDLR